MAAHITFLKCTIMKCIQNNNDVNFALLQIRSLPIGAGIPSPATLLFYRPIRALLPQIGREPINISDAYYKALKSKHKPYIKKNDTCKNSYLIFHRIYSNCFQREDRDP